MMRVLGVECNIPSLWALKSVSSQAQSTLLRKKLLFLRRFSFRSVLMFREHPNLNTAAAKTVLINQNDTLSA